MSCTCSVFGGVIGLVASMDTCAELATAWTLRLRVDSMTRVATTFVHVGSLHMISERIKSTLVVLAPSIDP